MEFNVSADIVEVNRFKFTVEAETKEEAETKLKAFLEENCPYTSQDDPINGVVCYDMESSMETRGTESISVNDYS